MEGRIATIRTTDVWNVNASGLRPEASFRKEEYGPVAPSTNEDSEFLVDPYDFRPIKVEVQRIVKSSLQIFKRATLGIHLRVMVDTKVITILETANQEAGSGEMTVIFQDMEKSYVKRLLEVPPKKSYTQSWVASPSHSTLSITSHQIDTKIH